MSPATTGTILKMKNRAGGNRKRHRTPQKYSVVKLLCMHPKVFKLLKALHKQYNNQSEISSEVTVSKKAGVSEQNVAQINFIYESLGCGSSPLDTKRYLKQSRSQEQIEQWLDSLECEQALRNLGVKR